MAEKSKSSLDDSDDVCQGRTLSSLEKSIEAAAEKKYLEWRYAGYTAYQQSVTKLDGSKDE